MGLRPQGKKEIQVGPKERDHQTPLFFEPREKPPFLLCPFCVQRMETVRLGKTKVDQCEKCGSVWLEEPKLKMLQVLLRFYKYRMSGPKKGPGWRRE
jgi:ribosomal protein L37AE/L43A